MNACTWKSMDGGSTWSYIGQPDGAQAAGSGLGFVGVGAGGGDEDIIALPNGNIVLCPPMTGNGWPALIQTWSTSPANSWARF